MGKSQKQMEKYKRELIHEMLDLVLDINGLGDRKREITGDQPTMSFDFSGHIGVITTRLFTHGWYPFADPDKDTWTHADSLEDLEHTVQKLRAIKTETPVAGTARESR